MPTIQEILVPMQTVLQDAAHDAGFTSGFIRRPTATHLSAETFVTSLVFACLGENQPTLDDFATNSVVLGAPVSPQAFDERFNLRAVACLPQVLETALAQRIQAEPRAIPLLTRFTGVYLADCTVLDLPDAVAALDVTGHEVARKLLVSLDYSTGGRWLHPPQATHHHDSATPLQRQILPVGALRVTDLGFYDLGVLHDYTEQGVYWISRLKTNAVVYTDAGAAWMIDVAAAAAPDTQVFDLPVVVGNRHMVACRLVALRHVADNATDTTPTWHVYITNCPPTLLSTAAISTLYALRWQIELLFKQWKAENVLRQWRTVRPCRIVCEVYARLIALLITHWATVLTVWDNPATSLSRAARRVKAERYRLCWSTPVYLPPLPCCPALLRCCAVHALSPLVNLSSLRTNVCAIPPPFHPHLHLRLSQILSLKTPLFRLWSLLDRYAGLFPRETWEKCDMETAYEARDVQGPFSETTLRIHCSITISNR